MKHQGKIVLEQFPSHRDEEKVYYVVKELHNRTVPLVGQEVKQSDVDSYLQDGIDVKIVAGKRKR
jgi:hypothetical protein